MDGRASRAFLIAVVALCIALVVGAAMLVMTALSQTDLLHQILLVGMGIVFVGSGIVLLVVEVLAYIGEHSARSKTKK